MWQALFPVMLFADAVAMAILYFTPLPVFSLMGGIRLSESEQLIQSTAFFVGILGVLSSPIWLIGTIVTFFRKKSDFVANPDDTQHDKVSEPLWSLAAVSLLIWCAILPITQPEQQLRHRVESLLHEGKFPAAVQLMSAHQRSDFPAHWDPPPRVGYGESSPSVVDVMLAILQTDAQPWVADLYLEKYGNYLGKGYRWYTFWQGMNDNRFDRHLSILESLPDDSALLVENREAFERMLKKGTERSTNQQNRIRRLLDRLPEPKPEPASVTDAP